MADLGVRSGAGDPAASSGSTPQHGDLLPGAALRERLRAVARELTALRQALAETCEIDPLSREWPQLVIAAELVVSAAGGFAAPPSEDAALTHSTTTEATETAEADTQVPAGLEAVPSAILDDLSATETPPADDERAALVAALRPRLQNALDDALAGVSLPELRALAAHPDPLAALVLVVGLAARAEALDPVVSQDDAALLLAELGVTRAAIQHLITEDVLPARPRRSDVLVLSVGEALAAVRHVHRSPRRGA